MAPLRAPLVGRALPETAVPRASACPPPPQSRASHRARQGRRASGSGVRARSAPTPPLLRRAGPSCRRQASVVATSNPPAPANSASQRPGAGRFGAASSVIGGASAAGDNGARGQRGLLPLRAMRASQGRRQGRDSPPERPGGRVRRLIGRQTLGPTNRRWRFERCREGPALRSLRSLRVIFATLAWLATRKRRLPTCIRQQTRPRGQR